MPGGNYFTNLEGISDVQIDIMRFISDWVRVKRVLVTQKAIVENMREKGVKTKAVQHALKNLVRDGYIRYSVQISNKTSYVQLRTVL